MRPAPVSLFSLVRTLSSHSGPRSLSTTTSIQSPPEMPMLLLEGDAFHVDREGTARTYYELKQWPSYGNNNDTDDEQISPPPLALEERYDLGRAKKTFCLRSTATRSDPQVAPLSLLSKYADGLVSIGKMISQIELQEADQKLFSDDGSLDATGFTTWESSISMSLLFSTQPQLLRGSVLELGSGVGLGGILMSRVAPTDTSITLSDGNSKVLAECRRNVHNAGEVGTNFLQIDWHKPPSKNRSLRFDTIVASDCAYKYHDVLALAATMKQLLRPSGTIHIFGPHNRPAIQQLLSELQHHGFALQVNGIQMSRYRLRTTEQEDDGGEALFASRYESSFLHAIATPRAARPESTVRDGGRLDDID